MPPAAPSVADLLADLAAVFRRLRARWYVFGAQALVVRGLPRATADVDVTVLWTSSNDLLASALSGGGFTVPAASPAFLTATRVLPVIDRATGIPVDVVLGGAGLELFANHAEKMRIGRRLIPVATATDMAVMKMIAGRPKDIEDARSLLGTGAVDLAAVDELLRAFSDAVGESDAIDRWGALTAVAPKRRAKAVGSKPVARRPKPPR